ncbi:MAG: hypothetical protein ACLTLQ_14835 [[Clostridium] scindens]
MPGSLDDAKALELAGMPVGKIRSNQPAPPKVGISLREESSTYTDLP